VILPVLAASALLAATSAGCGGDDARGKAAAGATRKVTVAGDSISVGLGSRLRDAVPADTTVKVIGVEGTGLARPDRFDWPARLRTLAADFPPSVLVFSVGSNDHQDLTDASGTTVVARSDPGWDAEYSRRLAASFDAFEGTGTTVVWVGHVRTEDPDVGATNRHIHELATRVADGRPWVRVADLGDLVGSGDGVATACLRPDGLHLTTACLDRADRALAPQLRD
jgi:uncharacterized protein